MEESARKLATVQIIEELIPIKKKDRIELAKVLGWFVIVRKGTYKVGDRTVFFEVDSLLPGDDPRHADLHVYTKGTGRVKTLKMAGVISQGLCLSYSELLPKELLAASAQFDDGQLPVGTDLTAILRVEKYESDPDNRPNGPNKGKGSGPVRGYLAPFPAAVRKTDETRVQLLEVQIRAAQGQEVYITEKLDGSSMTLVWPKGGEFMVCSRNKQLLTELPPLTWWQRVQEWCSNAVDRAFGATAVSYRKMTNPITECFWRTTMELGLHGAVGIKVRAAYPGGVAVQGELIGPGRNGNKHKLDHLEYHIFSVFDIASYRYLGYDAVVDFAELIGVKMVPVLDAHLSLNHTVPELIKLAEGKSLIGNLKHREGIVVRTMDGQFSMKAINPQFLLKEDA